MSDPTASGERRGRWPVPVDADIAAATGEKVARTRFNPHPVFSPEES